MSEPLGIPQARFIDQRTGDISREWRFFLLALWTRSGGSLVDFSTEIAPPISDVVAVGVVSDDVTPPGQSAVIASDDVTPPAQLAVVVADDVNADAARIEALEGQLKALRDEIEALKRGITA